MRSKFKWIFTLLVAFLVQFSFAQEKTVTGIVSDAIGPLAGANVVVQGTMNGATTNFDGAYSIKANQGDVLVFTYTGMVTSTAVVGTSNVVNATMQEAILKGGEVIVTGALGLQKKADAVTSAFTVVGSDEMTVASNPNAVRSLAGKVAGLQINNASNGVNGNTTIQLRTQISFSKSNDALVVIDGVPSTATVFANMPPDMVESVNVIKGSQGAALYGAQGVNGVLIVTTKRGSKGNQVSVNFHSSLDFESVSFVPEKQDKYGQGWSGSWDQYENGGWGELFDGSIRPVGLIQSDGTYIQAPYSAIKDNLKQFYKDGTILQNGVAIRLGNDKSYASFSADNQLRDFVVEGDEFKRSNFLFRAGTKGDRWSVDGTFNYRVSKTNQSDTGTTLLELQQAASNIPIGQFDNGQGQGGWTVYYNNPFWRRDNNRLNNTADYFNTALKAGFKINKNIDLAYSGGVQYTTSLQESYTNELVEDDTTADSPFLAGSLGQSSSYYRYASSNRYYYGDLMANFNYDLTEDLNFKATLGHNMQMRNFNRLSQGGQNLDIPGWYNINNVLNPDSPARLFNSGVDSNNTAEFLSVDLGYKDYLFLNVTSRYEHTSLLLAKNRNFFYPSAGLSFIASKYKDLSSAKISYLKLYANATKVGSVDAINSGSVLNVNGLGLGFPFPNTGNSFQDFSGVTDPNIKPEFYTTFEAGFTLGMFDDKITLDAAAFMTETSNAISDVAGSSWSGSSSFRTNIGSVKTKGLEVTLGFTPIRNENFKWSGNINFSAYKNEVTKLNDGGQTISLHDITAFDGSIVATLGESFPYLMGTDWLKDPQGNVIIDATTGLPSVNPEQQKLGKVNPDYTLGLTNNFSYKGVGLSFTTDYRKGGYIFSESIGNMTWSGHIVESANYDRDLGFLFPGSVNEVTPGVFTPNTTNTAAGYGSNGSIAYHGTLSNLGSHSLVDATFLKVREIALSYTLPNTITKSLGIDSFKVSVNARNPFVILADGNRGYVDPEASSQYDSSNVNAAKGLFTSDNTNPVARGYARVGQYPSTRTFGFALNVGF